MIMDAQSNNRDRQQFGLISTVIQIIVVILGIAALAHVTMKIRLAHIIAATKTLIAQLSQIKVKDFCIEIAKVYFIYILLSIILVICIFYVTRIVLDSREAHNNSYSILYFQRYFKPIVIFLLLFYAANVANTTISRKHYAKFYEDFKEGRMGSDFKGYKEYHFLNHADQTKRILSKLNEKAKNSEQIALIEGLKDLVKKQDKNLSAFRSYVANYNLLFKLSNIFYYFVGFIGVIAIVIILSMHNCCLKTQKTQSQYGSIEEHEQDQTSEQSLIKCPQQTAKRKCASSCYIFLVLIMFSVSILASFILGDIFLELKLGHPYNNNIEQMEVCSFHKHMGGFFINIDYQIQLDLAQQYGQVQNLFNQDSEEAIEQVNKLHQYIKIYANLCEILQPYYQRNKNLQSNLAEIFYRHFYAFVYLFWRYYRILRESKIIDVDAI